MKEEVHRRSGVMKVLSTFTYGGCKVVLRRWYNCYEYLLVHNGEIFCDYIEFGKKKSEPDDYELRYVLDFLRGGAIQTIDYHNERSIGGKFKKLIKNKFTNAKEEENDAAPREVTEAVRVR